jgi:hypothetical protein
LATINTDIATAQTRLVDGKEDLQTLFEDARGSQKIKCQFYGHSHRRYVFIIVQLFLLQFAKEI